MIYFKGLNGIRAIAALLVVIWHTDQFSNLFKLTEIGFNKNGMAGYAVDMFFVLSGFLITYLLFIEKEKTGTINFKKFYLRRIFRIWPIYYLAVSIALILIYLDIIPIHGINLNYSIFLYLFFMANVAKILGLKLPFISPLWSVGVEEQYYLIWPHLIKRTTNYIKSFIIFLIVFWFIKFIAYYFLSPTSTLYQFLSITRLNIMCIGAIGAYLVHSKHKILKIIYRKDLQVISWLILIISCVYQPIHLYSFIDPEVNALFYLIIILNVATNNNNLISLENKLMNFIGKISYGIYVYHLLVLFLLSKIIIHYNLHLNHLSIFTIEILSSIMVATISFYYFEKPFLTLKHKYSVIKSTNSSTPTLG